MKHNESKSTTIILSIIVITIWAAVVWVAVSSFGGRGSTPAENSRNSAVAAVTSDTLRLDYPDPFLKRQASAGSEIKRDSSFEEYHENPIPHNFQYLGHILNKARGTDTHIICIDGHRYNLIPGQCAGDLRLTKAAADCLTFTDINTNHKYKVSL